MLDPSHPDNEAFYRDVIDKGLTGAVDWALDLLKAEDTAPMAALLFCLHKNETDLLGRLARNPHFGLSTGRWYVLRIAIELGKTAAVDVLAPRLSTEAVTGLARFLMADNVPERRHRSDDRWQRGMEAFSLYLPPDLHDAWIGMFGEVCTKLVARQLSAALPAPGEGHPDPAIPAAQKTRL